jgi:hypothetical protein
MIVVSPLVYDRAYSAAVEACGHADDQETMPPTHIFRQKKEVARCQGKI